jgi:phosphate transport system substrate-binding protein
MEYAGERTMRFRRLVFGLCLIATTIPVSPPPANWAQVGPPLSPTLPSYLPQEHVSGTLDISVAETIKPLVQAWLDDMAVRHPQLEVLVAAEKSGNGLDALLEHRTEVAAMPRRLTAAELAEFVREYGYEPTEVPIAGDALAVYVHKVNPLTGLSLEELDAMFCRERQRGVPFDIDSWGLVGVMDDWFDAPITLYGRNGSSATSAFFREEVCKHGSLIPKLVDADGAASVVLGIERDPHGIGFGAVGYATSMVKPVPIASVKGGRYVEPTLQALQDGSYPLRRNLYLYIAKPPKAPPTQPSAELVRFVLSRQGQQVALDLGYIPLASEDVTRLRAKWATPSNMDSTGATASTSS